MFAESRPSVKYVLWVDYPLAGKDKYIAWVDSVSGDLLAPAEVRRIGSYDNHFGASPHRAVGFEFDSLEDAAKYFSNEKVRAVLDDLPNRGINASLQVWRLRGDYTPK